MTRKRKKPIKKIWFRTIQYYTDNPNVPMNPYDLSMFRRVYGFRKKYVVTKDGLVIRIQTQEPAYTYFHSVKKRPYVAMKAHSGNWVFSMLHVVVAESWICPRPDGHEVFFLDGNRMNIHADNMGWRSKSKRLIDSKAHLGENNPNAKLTADKVRYIRESSASNAALSRELGVTAKYIEELRLPNPPYWKHI